MSAVSRQISWPDPLNQYSNKTRYHGTFFLGCAWFEIHPNCNAIFSGSCFSLLYSLVYNKNKARGKKLYIKFPRAGANVTRCYRSAVREKWNKPAFQKIVHLVLTNISTVYYYTAAAFSPLRSDGERMHSEGAGRSD